jgi:AraC family transcriptional regulator, positive regulator of tynA and feaB
LDAWQAALNESHLSWTLCDTRKAGFSADILVGRLPDLQVVQCVCQPCSGFRGSREIGAGNATYYGLLLVYQGHEEVKTGSREAILGPGDILLWDSTEPIRFRLQSPIHKITVFVPQSRMHDALPQARHLVGKIFDWRYGLGAVTASHIAALASQAPYLEETQTHPVGETTLELIATSLGSQYAEAGEPARAEMITTIKKYIESHLDDPDLGPQGLAVRFSISLRYLHLLFARFGTSVSRWILDRRLERCRRELVVAGPHKNITDVAFAWGFNDAAHFSRVFKNRYGVTPREYRRGKAARRMSVE